MGEQLKLQRVNPIATKVYVRSKQSLSLACS